MIVSKIIIPGRFEDAFIYRGYLIAVTEELTLKWVQLDLLANQIRSDQHEPWPELLFVRNDWLNSGTFKAVQKSPVIRDHLARSLTGFASTEHIVNADWDWSEFDPKMGAERLYDFHIYNGRVYFTSEKGIYDVDPDWTSQGPWLHGSVARRRFDAKCTYISSGYGCINASCGKEGLFTSFDDFNSLHPKGKAPEFHKTTEKSIRSSWAGYDVVNYESKSEPTYLRSHKESAKNSVEHQRSILTSFEPEEGLDYLLSSLFEAENVQPADVQFIYNSNRVFFVHTYGGQFYSLGFQKHPVHKDKLVQSWSSTYKGQHTRINSAHMLRSSTLIETDQRIWLFADNEWTSVLEGEVISLRTFVRSKRFQHMMCFVQENAIILGSMFDESILDSPDATT